jgi:hypothetical protein
MPNQNLHVARVVNRFVGTNRQVTTTLEGYAYTPQRRSGNTTRQIDRAVQLFFEGYIVICFDHHGYGDHPHLNIDLLKRVKFRLLGEFKIPPEQIVTSKSDCIIYKI